MGGKIIPFCPKCGKKEAVKVLSEYLNSWQCLNCSIRFDFSEIGENTLSVKIRTPYVSSRRVILDPARKVILDPAIRSVIDKYGIIDLKGGKYRKGGRSGPAKLK